MSWEQPYAGLPSGGGFEPYTEYEIGMARVAEAVHCIIGSLVKSRGENSNRWFLLERQHIKEELQIIDDAMVEYYKPLYRERFNRTSSDEHVKRIRTKAGKLAQYSRRLLSDMPETTVLYWNNIAEASLRFLITFADEIEKTMNALPVYDDVFSSWPVMKRFRDLSSIIEEWMETVS